MPPKHLFDYIFTDSDGKEVKNVQPQGSLILEHAQGNASVPQFLAGPASIELDVTYDPNEEPVKLECVNVCKCPRCGAEAPIFKRDEDDHLLYGHCPKCDFKACKGGEDLKSAADGWNRTVKLVAQDIYWRLTQTGPYTPEEKHDE